MDCPKCGERLRYLGYVTKEHDQHWWCKSCDVQWWHSHLQALKRRARVYETPRQRLDAFLDSVGEE